MQWANCGLRSGINRWELYRVVLDSSHGAGRGSCKDWHRLYGILFQRRHGILRWQSCGLCRILNNMRGHENRRRGWSFFLFDNKLSRAGAAASLASWGWTTDWEAGGRTASAGPRRHRRIIKTRCESKKTHNFALCKFTSMALGPTTKSHSKRLTCRPVHARTAVAGRRSLPSPSVACEGSRMKVHERIVAAADLIHGRLGGPWMSSFTNTYRK